MDEVNQTPQTSEEDEQEQEEEQEEEEPTYWDAVYGTWRNGNQLWLVTFGGGPSGGYIIDYSSRPRAVFRWRRRLGQDVVITPFPDGVRLLYGFPP